LLKTTTGWRLVEPNIVYIDHTELAKSVTLKPHNDEVKELWLMTPDVGW
jgi:hypothetical protein